MLVRSQATGETYDYDEPYQVVKQERDKARRDLAKCQATLAAISALKAYLEDELEHDRPD